MKAKQSKQANTVRTRNKRGSETVVALGLTENPWIYAEAKQRGWRLFNLNYCGGSVPAGLDFKGAILIRYEEDPWVQAMRDRDCPTVFVGDIEALTDMLQPSVTPDMFAEGQLAAEHFADRSFRQLAYFGHVPWGEGKPLWEGFSSRAQELGIEISLFQTENRPDESNDVRDARRRQEFTDWIREIPKPVGLLAPGDAIAALYCTWASLAGFDIPSQVAVLARGIRPFVSETFLPTISHLDLDGQAQIRVACDLLTRLMAGEEISEKRVLIKPRGVIVHETTDLLATPDREVAAVLRYMWDNLDLKLTVEDAARQVDISSRQLARKFKKALNRTFRQELRRKRLEETRGLLRHTDHKLAIIAARVGFQSTSYLHRAFRRAFGMTPIQYRKGKRRSSS